jgi:tripartite-type tricarboxylate transporter receptor subunit TctC
MRLSRRELLTLATRGAVLAAVLPAFPRIAGALDYPTRPVRFIVGWPAGGTGDILARIVGQWLSGRLGQPLIVDNRPGAASNLSVQTTISLPADGYTLVYLSSSNAINASFYRTLAFDLDRDITPIAGLARVPFVMDVHPSVPAKTLADFIAYARSNPGKVNVASFGIGSPSHLAGELLKSMTGVDMIHVPYRGAGPALTDLIAGQVQVYFDALPASLPHIQRGAIRALAVTTAERADALPDVPTVGETVPGYEVSGWSGIGVRSGTPREIIDRLNGDINAGLENPSIKARFRELSITPLALSPAQFGAYVAAETAKWRPLIRAAGIRAD